MLTYHIVRRKNIKTGTLLYYPQLVSPVVNDHNKIIERIEKKCTLASADVKAVIDALEVEIIDCLQQGQSVRLGDLGSFRPSLRCGKGVTKPEEVSASLIKRVHIVFHPSARIRRALSVKDHAVSFHFRDKKKKEGNVPSGTKPSGGGGTPGGTATPGGTPVPAGNPSAGATSGTPGTPGGTATPGGTPVPAGTPSTGATSGTTGTPGGTATPGGTPVPVGTPSTGAAAGTGTAASGAVAPGGLPIAPSGGI